MIKVLETLSQVLDRIVSELQDLVFLVGASTPYSEASFFEVLDCLRDLCGELNELLLGLVLVVGLFFLFFRLWGESLLCWLRRESGDWLVLLH